MARLRRIGLLLGIIVLGLIIPACAVQEHCKQLCSTCLDGYEGSSHDFEPAVKSLAHEIDHVEHHINKYGTISAKTPAIWGEARLTKHRQEFERQMEGELGKFTLALNGYLSRSDQAYLAQALTLSAAISGQEAKILDATGTPTSTTIPVPPITTVTQNLVSPVVVPTSTIEPGTGKVTYSVPASNSATQLYQTPLLSGLPTGTLFQGMASNSIALEPTVQLDQRARYLNHLHEIRRINEGDDTADSPGYALYLVRVPISVTPGKCTRVGHGAEITLSINSQYGEELLPKTYRNLVVNDLVDLLGLPVYEYAKGAVTAAASEKLEEEAKKSPTEKGDLKIRYDSLSVRQKNEVRKLMPLFKDFQPSDIITIPAPVIARMKVEGKKQKMEAVSAAQAMRIPISNGRRAPAIASQSGW